MTTLILLCKDGKEIPFTVCEYPNETTLLKISKIMGCPIISRGMKHFEKGIDEIKVEWKHGDLYEDHQEAGSVK